jgi:hypothetical protein
MVEALKSEPELRDAVIKELKRRDVEGSIPVLPEDVKSQEESA